MPPVLTERPSRSVPSASKGEYFNRTVGGWAADSGGARTVVAISRKRKRTTRRQIMGPLRTGRTTLPTRLVVRVAPGLIWQGLPTTSAAGSDIQVDAPCAQRTACFAARGVARTALLKAALHHDQAAG